MKLKIITIVSVIILIIAVLIAAINVNEEKNSNFNIVTSFYPVYIATLNVTDSVEGVNVELLTKESAGCIHDYTLTTSELVSLSNAQVLIINGASMEGFMDKVIDSYKDLNIIDTSNGIKLIENEETHHEKVDGIEAHEQHEYNSHIFVSIKNYIKQVQNITEGLIKLNPENKEKYIINCNKYIEKLNNLKEEALLVINSLSSKNIVTFHNSFDYFALEYGLNVVGTIEHEHGTSPSASEIAKLINKVKEQKVKAIFIEPDSNRKIAETISKETNALIYELNPVTKGKADKDEYINIMRNNLELIKEALR